MRAFGLPEHARTGNKASSGKGQTAQAGVSWRSRLIAASAVVSILAALTLNTTLAIHQTHEQARALSQQRAVASVKHQLDALQDDLLDEHEQLYTVIGTRPFFRRPDYIYPLPALLDYATAAQQTCGSEARCVELLDQLKGMIEQLGRLSNQLAMRALLKPGSVTISAPMLGELDARFFQTMQKIGEIRMAEDAHLATSVNKSTRDAQLVSNLLLASGLAAGVLLLAFIRRNARITRSLRAALHTADTNREKELAAQAELFRSMQMLEQVLDNIPVGVAWKDPSHRYAGGNEIYARDAGLPSRRELIGLTDAQLRWGDDPAAVRAEDARIMAGEFVKKRVERSATAVDGSKVWIAETKLPIVDPSGNGMGVLTAYENITAMRESQLALRLQGRALDASIGGIVIAEAKGGVHPITYANRAFEKLTGLRFTDIAGTDFATLFIGQNSAGNWDEVRAALQSDIDANLTLQCEREDGARFWSNMLIAPVRNTRGLLTHHVVSMSDVTAVVRYQAELKHQAEYDALTGLPNRKQLDTRLDAALEQAAQRGESVAVVFLDLDHFKEVNDSLGHRVGDALLTQIARRLERVVGDDRTVARYGGDEFMVIAAGGGARDLVPLLEGLLAVMAEPVRVAGHELFIEASIGISIYPGDGTDADILIRNADAAMYLAKQNGRNQYQFYRPELSETATSRLRMSTRLRRAFKSGLLRVLYQPQFDMQSGAMIGAEALLRWSDPELGEVSPAIFIPVAEETGLIRAIGEWVLREACHEGARWNAAPGRGIGVSVNVSPLQLEHSDLVEQVGAALRESGLAPGLLELEVTESALMRNPEHASRTLVRLREMGVRIAIDDFGTGYSSLSYLKRFRVDRLKIDREFVKEIGVDTETEAITLAVIAVAKALNFELLAEGVETSRHRDFLVENGCTQAQGFLYSRAIPADAIAGMLRALATSNDDDAAVVLTPA
ncbi:putative bifunctional diguanylate cyclase/phosphodiesterase [Paraburkholderia acidisoli]|uniref:EAL domain-containing protein n=1 Tax=Paraburkholderia acidisoli TaxID=2571748 RepID=A0A7Z2GRH0_9BURK|nr:EAL domain-containing protein [Paraburkholderia acidisoli]QGZ66617.1 EAL domain-containing protein [Paraburkholderia acidisoli]